MKSSLLFFALMSIAQITFAQCSPEACDTKQGVWEPLTHQASTPTVFKNQATQLLQLFKNIIPTPQGANHLSDTYGNYNGVFPDLPNKKEIKLTGNTLKINITEYYCSQKGVMKTAMSGDYKYKILVASNDLQQLTFSAGSSTHSEWIRLMPTGTTKEGYPIFNHQTILVSKKDKPLLLPVSRRMVLNDYAETLSTMTDAANKEKYQKNLELIKSQYTDKQLDEQAFLQGRIEGIWNLEDYIPGARFTPLFRNANQSANGLYRLNPDYFDVQPATKTQVIVMDLEFDMEAPQRWNEKHPFLTRLRENILTNFDFSKLAEMLGK